MCVPVHDLVWSGEAVKKKKKARKILVFFYLCVGVAVCERERPIRAVTTDYDFKYSICYKAIWLLLGVCVCACMYVCGACVCVCVCASM